MKPTSSLIDDVKISLDERALVAVVNSKGVIIDANQNFCSRLQHTRPELLSQNHHLIDPHLHPPEMLRHVTTTLASGHVWIGEIAHQAKDGSSHSFTAIIIPFINEKQQWEQSLAILADCTAQNNVALRRERDRAREYLDIAQVILLRLDLEGHIALANQFAASLLGVAEEELLGRDWIECCLPARFRPGCREKFRRLLAGDNSPIESVVLSKSGEERIIEWRSTTVHDDEGRLIGTLSSGTDITDRQRAIEALRVAEERTRFALEAAAIGIWDWDYTNGFLHWSEILQSQCGFPPGAFGGTFQEFIKCVHPEDREYLEDAIRTAENSGDDFSVVHRVVWPDESVHWLRQTGRVHREDGHPTRGIGISQDITERMLAEAESKRLSQEIQLQRLRVFKATMNTVQDIVNNFLNGLQLMQVEAPGILPPAVQDIIDRSIQDTAAQLNTLANLETITERQMAIGPGIAIPPGHLEFDD